MIGSRIKDVAKLLVGSLILAFGLFNIHSFSGVTEGGTLGLTLLFEKLLSISPSVTAIVLNGACYLFGWRTLGKKFIIYSGIATGAFSLFYFIFALIGPLFPTIGEHRLLAALLGALFVGVGVGLCVRAGGAPCGDDALAMSIHKLTGLGIRWVYLISDIIVLALSLLYIPIDKILYSLLTVTLSGQIIGVIDGFGRKRRKAVAKNDEKEKL
jgi:uncharacterized membrane-anchored protein YitT (DUF2179 family)